MKKKICNFNYFGIRPYEDLMPNHIVPDCKRSNFYELEEIDKRFSVNFVLNDYLALSNDERINQGVVRAICDGVNVTYPSELMHRKAEEYLSWIFDSPVLLFPNSAMIHMHVMPKLINAADTVILDNNVHSSLRIAADLLKNSGKYVETIEHNSIHILEERICDLKNNHRKVWYLADSIYSIPGDVFPMGEIQRLLEKYEQFYVYIDDSKGMSWTGENGKGYVHSNLHHHPKVVLSASLGKGFGSEGGVLVCYDEAMKKRVLKTTKFSGYKSLLKPAVLGSIIESAKIHLSNEIYVKQAELQKKIGLFNTTSSGLGLPVISTPDTPVVFFLMGKPDISQEICFNLLKKGYYLNVANFPIVPYNGSGIMANVTLHQSKDDIRNMLYVFRDEYDKALKKRNLITHDILRNYNIHEQMS